METNKILNEPILPDDYPVHYDFAYIVDDTPILSDFGGGATVADMKRYLPCKEVRRCDLAGRGLL